jgi:hypothetical protein
VHSIVSMPDTSSDAQLSDHIVAWLTDLESSRPIFHSEIDFQLALSRVTIDHGVKRVRLERRIPLPELLRGRRHPEIDIMAVLGDSKIALELKYPKKKFTATGVITDGETEDFDLPGGNAPDRDASAIWHDAERIEQLLNHGIVEAGAGITLTNYAFWVNTNLKANTRAHAFNLWDQRHVPAGTPLDWHADTAESYRTEPVRLRSSYVCNWHEYSSRAGTEFRYLILEPGRSRQTLCGS